MSTVYMGIGSNLADRYANCKESVIRVGEIDGVEVIALSSFYETDPVGGPPQGRYINGVACLECDIDLLDLLSELKNIERKMGRNDSHLKDHPRMIDLDILLCGDIVLELDVLKVPHPRMHERAFVLKGFSEISPDVVHPVLGKTVSELLKDTEGF